VWVCVCMGFVKCGCVYICGFCNVLACVGVGVLVICVLVFTVFCVVCTVFVLFSLCKFILICCVWTRVKLKYRHRVKTQLQYIIIIIIISEHNTTTLVAGCRFAYTHSPTLPQYEAEC
jgi:hypothetical protein